MRSVPALLMLCLVLTVFSFSFEARASEHSLPFSLDDLGLKRVAFKMDLKELTSGANLCWGRIDGNDLFLLDSNNTFHAIGLPKGLHKWIVKLPGKPTHEPGIGTNRIGFVVRDQVILVDRTTGSRVLDVALRIFPSTAPAVTDDSLYVGVFIEKKLLSLDNAEGLSGWSYRFKDILTVDPKIYGEMGERFLYAAADDGTIICLPVKGALAAPPSEAMWTAKTRGKISKDFTLSGNHLFAASEDDSLYAYHRLTGEIVWRYYAGVPILAPAQAFENLVFVRTENGFFCLDGEKGTVKWSMETGMKVANVLENSVYLLTNNKTFAVVDRETGELKGETAPAENLCLIPSFGMDMVFVVHGAKIFALMEGKKELEPETAEVESE
ncbi:MAG: PQQ-binding-like beta-propeller repeat protein [Planctomycetes bacterium]|nr:PQQ-binding-like beta-propeller repeat protein [Planctomycetota bacterium]